MAEHASASLPAVGGVGGTVDQGTGAGAGAGQNALGWSFGAEVPVVKRVGRTWGEPRRCGGCGRPVNHAVPKLAGALGVTYCRTCEPHQAHMEGEPDALVPCGEGKRSVAAHRQAHGMAQAALEPVKRPIVEAIPVAAIPATSERDTRPTGTPSGSLRDRLRARYAPDRGEG